MELCSRFTFGRYKGLTLQEVYQGTLNPDRLLLQQYLDNILNSIDPSIPLGPVFEFIEKFAVSENTIQVVGTLEYFGTRVDSFGESQVVLSEIYFENLQGTLKSIINYHFQSNWLGILMNLPTFNAAQNEIKVIGGDPQYISWCIKEMPDFKITQKAITALQSLPVATFIGIEVLYVNPKVYEYAPIVRPEQYKFHEAILNLNRKK